MLKPLGSLLKIRSGEGRLVVLMGLLFACVQAGQGLGDNAASALFFRRFGVEYLPYMYIFLGGLTFLITMAYAAALGRFQRARFFLSLLLAVGVLLVFERLALSLELPALYPVIWLTVSCLGMILGTLTWQMAGEVSDARQAKRLFPLFTSAGILGSVAGNSVTGLIARLLGTENLLLLFAGLLGLACLLTRAITRSYFRPAKILVRRPSLWTDLRAGYDFVRSSSLLRLIAYASVLFSVLFFAIAFPFNKVVSAAYPEEAAVAGFLGTFSSVTTAVTLLVSLLLANRIYARLGIVNGVLLMPAVYLFGFVVFAGQYSLTGAVIARFSQLVVLSAIAGTAWNALFNVVPSQKRGQVLAFINGVPSQLGVALSGILLLVGERGLTTTQVFVMGILATLFCGVLVWRMRRAYGDALVEALRAGRLEVFSSEAGAFAGLHGDAAALQVAAKALRDSRPATRRLAAEMLGKMQNAAAVPALLEGLADTEASVRAAVIHALGALHAITALGLVLAALNDANAEVRLQALVALTPLEAQSSKALLARLESLLEDESTAIRTEAARMLAKLGRGQTALSAAITWLKDDRPSLRIAALETFAQLSAQVHAELEPAPLLAALQDPAPAVRAAACRALADFEDAGAMRGLVGCLHDPDADVRAAAASSLKSLGPPTRELLLKVLESPESIAWDAALDALTSLDPRAADALRRFARQEIERLSTLRIQLAGLPADGSALALLRGSVQGQLRLGEHRLVKVVGLISNPKAMEAVRKTIGHSDPEARAAALEALETLGDKALTRSIVSVLEEEPARHPLPEVFGGLFESQNRWHRALAVRAAQDLGLTMLTPKLAQLMSDHDPLVKKTALQSLCHFGEVQPMETLQTVSTLERILLLREVPIFAGLSPEDLEQLAAIAAEHWYPDGTTIFRQGEQANEMFIIVDGHVRVVRAGDGTEQVLAERGPGEILGEMAIIEAAPRSATLVTKGEVRVLSIDGDLFNGILRERPEVSLAVLRSVTRRLREMT